VNSKNLGYLPFACMGAFMLIIQLIALVLAGPMEAQNIRVFENPQSLMNPIWYIGLILLFTLLTLLIIKVNRRGILKAFILFVIWDTLLIVLSGMLSPVAPVDISAIGSLLGASALTVLLYRFPEWYVIDVTGILIGAGAATILGISLAIGPTLIFLVALMIYDAIAVYKTKHMLTLAEGVMGLKIPVLFIVPKRWGYSFLKTTHREGERSAYFMGLGDAVIPSILVVSANVFVDAPSFGFINLPALGAILGTQIGFVVLMSLVAKGKPQAGLPFLNTGAIIGFMVGYFGAAVL
jgi:presenilin-like A22 family membrane protease